MDEPANDPKPESRRWCIEAAVRAAPFACAWLVLFVAYAWPGDATPLGEWLTIWPPMLWTFALVPLTLFLATRRMWRLAVGTLAATLLFVLAHEEWRSLLRFGATPLADVRLLTWNVAGHDMNDPKFLAILERHRPDIVFVQESPGGAKSFAAGEVGGYFDGFAWLDAGDCGVLSRWPLRPLPARSVGPWSDPQMFACEVEPGREVLLVNVRLMLPSLVLVPLGRDGEALRGDNRLRVAQFPALAALIRETLDREGIEDAILAGDFNTGSWARSLAPLRAELRDAWDEGGRGWGRTMTAQFPVARIDQCWISEGLECVAARAHREAVSDHRAVLYELRRL